MCIDSSVYWGWIIQGCSLCFAFKVGGGGNGKTDYRWKCSSNLQRIPSPIYVSHANRMLSVNSVHFCFWFNFIPSECSVFELYLNILPHMHEHLFQFGKIFSVVASLTKIFWSKQHSSIKQVFQQTKPRNSCRRLVIGIAALSNVRDNRVSNKLVFIMKCHFKVNAVAI